MWKKSNCPTIQFLIVVFEAAPKTLKNVWKKWWMPSFPGNFSTCWEGQNPTSKNLIMSVNMFHVDPMAQLHRALLHILGCRSEAFCFQWWKIILYPCLLIKYWVTLPLACSSMDQYYSVTSRFNSFTTSSPLFFDAAWNIKRKTRVKRSKKQKLELYEPLQLTSFTSSLQYPLIPHRTDEGPLICFPLAQENEQIEPYLWLYKTQLSGKICTSFVKESFRHVNPLKEEI